MSREDEDNGGTSSTISFTSSADKFRILLNGMYVCCHGDCVSVQPLNKLNQAYNMMETVSNQ